MYIRNAARLRWRAGLGAVDYADRPRRRFAVTFSDVYVHTLFRRVRLSRTHNYFVSETMEKKKTFSVRLVWNMSTWFYFYFCYFFFNLFPNTKRNTSVAPVVRPRQIAAAPKEKPKFINRAKRSRNPRRSVRAHVRVCLLYYACCLNGLIFFSDSFVSGRTYLNGFLYKRARSTFRTCLREMCTTIIRACINHN